MARPTLVFLTLAAYVWLAGCFIDGGASGLAAFRGSLSPTLNERLVVTITVVAISLTPLVFWLRKMGNVWQNSVRSVELAQTLRKVVLGATVPYAFLALAIRAAAPFTDPRWPALLTAISLAAGVVVFAWSRIGRRRRR